MVRDNQRKLRKVVRRLLFFPYDLISIQILPTEGPDRKRQALSEFQMYRIYDYNKILFHNTLLQSRN